MAQHIEQTYKDGDWKGFKFTVKQFDSIVEAGSVNHDRLITIFQRGDALVPIPIESVTYIYFYRTPEHNSFARRSCPAGFQMARRLSLAPDRKIFSYSCQAFSESSESGELSPDNHSAYIQNWHNLSVLGCHLIAYNIPAVTPDLSRNKQDGANKYDTDVGYGAVDQYEGSRGVG